MLYLLNCLLTYGVNTIDAEHSSACIAVESGTF